MPELPDAILFDLDDTIIRAYAKPEEAWARLLDGYRAPLSAGPAGEDLDRLRGVIVSEARTFWSDPAAAARWRLDISGARRLVVRAAFARLGRADPALADELADAFTELRRREYALYPDSHATIDALRAAGVRLALVTNGQSEIQRAKVERFDLAHRFEHIQIEGEFGKGKPEPEVYVHALAKIGAPPARAWMVGDNLEWEVVMPQRLGMRGIWFDPHGDGLPDDAAARPDRVIRRLGELLE
ncbi:MAG: HAD family hydrolase [Rhodospirillales bacterium]|nr:HAD family hydrolase [Rhodospirillales bacterium]QQS14169.1 MAG: HAD family hydrolase [Rhodospirillales bacterium]